MFNAIRERLARDEDGFTLIELLVVVIIIGILAAIAIPTFLNQRQRGWQAQVTSDVRNTALDVEAAITANNGTPPAPAAGNALPATIPGTSTGGTTTFYYAVNGTNFCVVGWDNTTPARLPGSVSYRSAAGGLQPYAAAGTQTCTP